MTARPSIIEALDSAAPGTVLSVWRGDPERGHHQTQAAVLVGHGREQDRVRVRFCRGLGGMNRPRLVSADRVAVVWPRRIDPEDLT